MITSLSPPTGPRLHPGVRVLLIEDDPDDAFLIEHRLTSGGVAFVVDHVVGLEEAATQLAGTSYDVAVLDLGLPDSDGLDTVERFVSLEPSCAIVVMTRATDGDLATRSFALGVNDYLPKSAAATELLPRVLMHAVDREAARVAVAARMAAEEANVAKSAFLSRISHELRTPLHAILGFAQLLESEATTADDVESTGIIVKASEHLLSLITDVLDLSRMETGDLTLSLEPVDVAEIVSGAVELIRGQFPEARFELVGDDIGSLCVAGDRMRIHQVMLNLLSNALKYGPDDGPVTIGATRHDDRVRLGVTDHGPGIAPADLAVLFAPFERLGREHHGVDGVGLGLTVSRELVRAMNGVIGVDSVEGDGATFWFDLPVATSLGNGASAQRSDAGCRAAGFSADGAADRSSVPATAHV